MASQLHDRGAQPERTALAWTRTSLALFVATLVAARIAASGLGIVAVIIAVVACVSAITALVLTRQRYRHARRALHDGHGLPDGRLPAITAGVVIMLGLIEVAYVFAA